MAYQVIARKYRPQRFQDVVGQDHVTTTLSHAIEQARVAHAYLFCGPRGTGKTTVARIFAKCLNCTDGPRLDFADDDPRCVEIAEGRSLDVIEIDGASNRGIDEIRALRDTVRYAPATSKFKIYIIDEVHMLTKEAFNALLKTLEEPPAHVKFMFATTEPEKVLATILSRCQRFDLRRIPAALIVQHLAEIARKEKTKIDSAALYAIARGADGGMRDAESTLDQLISFCGEKIEEADVLSMFGLAAQGQVRDLLRSVLEADAANGLRLLEELCRGGKDLGRLLADLLGHGRSLMLAVVSGERAGGLEDLPEAEIQWLREQATGLTVTELTRIMEVLADGERLLRTASSRRIAFEVTLLKAMEARRAVSIDRLLQYLQQLRTGGGATSPLPSPAAAAKPTRTASSPRRRVTGPTATPEQPAAVSPGDTEPAAPVKSSKTSGEPRAQAAAPAPNAGGSLQDAWQALLTSLAGSHKFLHTYLTMAHPVEHTPRAFIIGFDPSVGDQLELVNTNRNTQVICDRLKELGFPTAEVRFVEAKTPDGQAPPTQAMSPSPAQPPPPSKVRARTVPAKGAARPAAAAEPPAGPAKPAPSASVDFDKENFKNDPLIRKALEVFRGDIVEIKP